MPSFVWNYFTKQDAMGARCDECNKVILYRNGTKGMISHLRAIHNIDDKSVSNPKRPASVVSELEGGFKKTKIDKKDKVKGMHVDNEMELIKFVQ